MANRIKVQMDKGPWMDYKLTKKVTARWLDMEKKSTYYGKIHLFFKHLQ